MAKRTGRRASRGRWRRPGIAAAAVILIGGVAMLFARQKTAGTPGAPPAQPPPAQPPPGYPGLYQPLHAFGHVYSIPVPGANPPRVFRFQVLDVQAANSEHAARYMISDIDGYFGNGAGYVFYWDAQSADTDPNIRWA